MKRLVPWFVLFVVAARSSAQEQSPSGVLYVELCDTSEFDPPMLQIARGEASQIFARAEARLQWESDCNAFPSTTPLSARIYLLPRIPAGIANRYYLDRQRSDVMGYLGFIEDVRQGPREGVGADRATVIYVARQSVEAVASRSGRVLLAETQLARAIGRVFAHELAHRFLGPEHSRNGILKESLDRRDLLDKNNHGLFFNPDQLRALRLLLLIGNRNSTGRGN